MGVVVRTNFKLPFCPFYHIFVDLHGTDNLQSVPAFSLLFYVLLTDFSTFFQFFGVV